MKKRGVGIALVVVLAFLLLIISSHKIGNERDVSALPSGKIIFVSIDFTDDPENHKWNTIQEGINDAEEGDIVYVFAGVYSENIFITKSITLLGEGSTIDGQNFYTVTVLADNIKIKNMNIIHGEKAGLYIGNYSYLTVENCSIYANDQYGIFAFSSNGNTFLNCSIYNNQKGGVHFIFSEQNSILNSEIYGGDWGVVFQNCSDCKIEDSIFSDQENKSINISYSNEITIKNCSISGSFCGIRLRASQNSTIDGCMITENIIGIRIDGSTSNEIKSCYIEDNVGYGIYAGEYGAPSQNNIIHHNNIVGNGNNAYDGYSNAWNTNIGNYWDDYDGIDANNDGIGDTPYVIPGGYAMDSHPLMNPIAEPPLFVWVDDDFDASSPGWGKDQFDNIQDGIDAVVENGTVYVYQGNYDINSAITIEKSLTLKGEGDVFLNSSANGIFIHAGNVNISGIKIESKDNGIKVVNSYNVIIKNCSSNGAIFGLYLVNSYDCYISNSQFFNNVKGIYLFNATYVTMNNLFIHNNSYFGMEIAHHSMDNIIFDSQIENNGEYGIYIFQDSNDNKIWHNNFINNTAYDACSNEWGYLYEYALGNYWSDYTGNDGNNDGMGDVPYIIEGGEADEHPLMNPIAEPPFFAWVNPIYNSSIPGWKLDHFISISKAVNAIREKGGCFVFNGVYKENVELNKEMIITGEDEQTTLVEGEEGSSFTISAENVIVQHMSMENCWDDAGIAILASHATINSCMVSSNYYGIFVNAMNATIKKSTIKENSFIGIWLLESDGAEIKECLIEGNNDGIVFQESHYSTIEECTISSNSFTGIRMEFSLENTIHSCIIEKNICGLYLHTSYANTIFFNDFIENEEHAYDDGQNSYDNGSIGNYWDDYEGIDENRDGIGDNPYSIEGDGNTDNYPLIRRKGLPIAYLSYDPSENVSTSDIISFFDESVDLEGHITAWLWKFGDGNVSYEKNPTHCYGDDGTYAINLTVWDDDGNVAMTEEIIEVANTLPVANFSWVPSLPNDREVVYFSDESVDIDGSIVSWLWDFGDGNTSNEENPSHMYADDGNYTVVLTVEDDDGASDTTQKIITIVNIPPNADFLWTPASPSTSDFIHFMDNSSDEDGFILSYIWDFGDGNKSYEKNVMHKYADNGTYLVTLTVEDNDNATNVAVKEITVANTPPIANFSFSPASPKDVQAVTFADLSLDIDGSIVSWYWEFGDGETSTEQNPKHMYPDDGTYLINLTVTDDDGATNKTTKIILVRNDPPQADFYYLPSSPTDLDNISFHDVSGDADGKIISWHWIFGDENSSDEKNPSHRYRDNGIYTVKLTVTDDDGDSDTTAYSITIKNVPPIANFSYSPLSPTDLEKVTFVDNSSDADGSIVNYTWDFGDGNISHERNTSHVYADDGNYTVILTVEDDDGAKASIEEVIEVKNVAPIADFTYEPEKPRAKKAVTFSDLSTDKDGSVVAWYWDFGDGSTGDGLGKVITHSYDKKGKYTVILTIEDDDGAKATREKIIEVREKEETSGFDMVVLIAALSIMLILWKKRIGIWRR